MPSSTITGVHTVGVPVADQDAALTYYVDVLGFEPRLDAEVGPGMRWVEVAPPFSTTSIALVAAATASQSPGDTGVRFTVPDAEAEHTALRGRGVEVGELLRWEGVPPMFQLDDPDGNRFTVVEVRA